MDSKWCNDYITTSDDGRSWSHIKTLYCSPGCTHYCVCAQTQPPLSLSLFIALTMCMSFYSYFQKVGIAQKEVYNKSSTGLVASKQLWLSRKFVFQTQWSVTFFNHSEGGFATRGKLIKTRKYLQHRHLQICSAESDTAGQNDLFVGGTWSRCHLPKSCYVCLLSVLRWMVFYVLQAGMLWKLWLCFQGE